SPTFPTSVFLARAASVPKSSKIELPKGCSFATKKEFVLATIIGRRGAKTEAEGEQQAAEAGK
ncbi:MAG: hypothetical protein O7C68_00600, partial [Rickettsia endosymbiont of Ixodes ricinus]|nr:hypothetical protein [Rickettsia endosymbiont of Ixodes ricinus]